MSLHPKRDKILNYSTGSNYNNTYHKSDVYPNKLITEDRVLQNYEKRDELKKHLAYCIEKGWIEEENTSWMSDGHPEFRNIKITAQGIDYLIIQIQSD